MPSHSTAEAFLVAPQAGAAGWSAPARTRGTAWALMLASGFAGLGLQLVWTRQLGLGLGHDAAAVLAVITAFFGGLGLGALLLAPRVQRSAHPARWYAGCEALIGGWTLGLALFMAPANAALLQFIGAQPSPVMQWTLSFAGAFLMLLPATAAMGATLPAMERLLARPGTAPSLLPALYAANTLGAVLGVLAVAFWLLPALGLRQTAALCALLNFGCAAAALAWGAAAGATPAHAASPQAPDRRLQWTLAATGALGIGFEVLVVRVLSQVCENTVYTYALLLAIYLVGTAAGAAAFARWAPRLLAPQAMSDRLLAALAAACLLGGASLWGAQALKDAALAALGAGMPAALAAEALVAAAAFAPATLVMGALFSHLATQAAAQGLGVGRALGINTLGAALAPALFGLGLLPGFGPKTALLVLVAAYLALMSRRAWRGPGPWAVAGAAAALALLAPPLVFVNLDAGGRVISLREGPLGVVSVVEDEAGVRRLFIDNRQQEGSSHSLLADGRQALLPLLLHPAPRSALFLGLGTGVTASAAALDPALQVSAVELLPEVIEASALFAGELQGGAPNPRLQLVAADARRFVRTSAQQFDLVVADNFHPARSGSASLYTVEHFRAVQQRLAAGGLFCQWLPLHQLDLATLRSIVRSFQAVYPGGFALLATNSLDTPVLGLVARQDGGRFDGPAVARRVAGNGLPQGAAAFDLDDEFAVLGSFVAGPAALAAFAADAPLNTDDHPVVASLAPRITYAPDSRPRERLLALLRSMHLNPAELLAHAGPDESFAARLAAYWQARGAFIEAGMKVQPGGDARAMLAQVREPLLAVLRTSPEFRPAYDPLLRMAQALARSDPAAARELLQALAQLQPARSEASAALRRLGLR